MNNEKRINITDNDTIWLDYKSYLSTIMGDIAHKIYFEALKGVEEINQEVLQKTGKELTNKERFNYEIELLKTILERELKNKPEQLKSILKQF